MSSSYIF